MMKKFGFTLAEVLITLGIVGVVAALTTPALVLNSRNEQNAAKLAVVVSNLENAFTNAIASESVENMYRTQMWSNAGAINNASNVANKRIFAGELGRYLIFNGIRTDNNAAVDVYGTVNGDELLLTAMGNNGQTGAPLNPTDNGLFRRTVPINMKNGAIVFIRTFQEGEGGNTLTEEEAIARGTALRSRAAQIYIDVNGASAPNSLGRDVFGFYLGQNGILYPMGGYDQVAHDLNAFNANTPVRDWHDPASTVACLPERGIVTANFNVQGLADSLQGIGCTARLIEENYRMNY